LSNEAKTQQFLLGYSINQEKASETFRIEFFAGQSYVFVGANGAGKSRLGDQIARHHMQVCNRISAHRTILIPESALAPRSYQIESKEFELGHPSVLNPTLKYGNDPSKFVQNDFDKLLKVLFSEEADRSIEFRAASKKSRKTPVPSTKLDRVCAIFCRVLPHLKLTPKHGAIEVIRDPVTYHSSQLSDGERSIFYLAGQVLCAKENKVLIIDEPELHVHPAIQYKLWDLLEKERPDCSFVYFTHDISFASSRTSARKFSLYSFTYPNQWTLSEWEKNDIIPDDILALIAGSRKPVLFVEGEDGSLDANLYRQIYPKFTVIPAGSSNNVINWTKAYRNTRIFHHVDCSGLIDRDSREGAQLSDLTKNGIQTIPVTEIENLLCLWPIFKFVGNKTGHNNAEIKKAYEEFQKTVFAQFKTDLESFSLRQTKREIQFEISRLKFRTRKSDGAKEQLDQIKEDINKDVDVLNPQRRYEKFFKIAKEISEKNLFNELLQNYDNKGVLSLAAQSLELKRSLYERTALKAPFDSGKFKSFRDIFPKFSS